MRSEPVEIAPTHVIPAIQSEQAAQVSAAMPAPSPDGATRIQGAAGPAPLPDRRRAAVDRVRSGARRPEPV
jgi:hypothetical protein